ncbi:sensor histidine kinase [Pirellula sp. SH-Sr6A]|uniref:sensor histidine kinase n=1 Tax=Pirellula sp. SH-Sr6A TaxID=1632865 RepID=UPI00143AB2AC|nr:HAMP domain-containing sensor histidine kinase [Pirellula sp. SH-Sr6A]
MFALSLHATYRRAESDLLAAAQELNQQLKDQPDSPSLEVSDLYRHRFGMAPRDHAYIAMWDQMGRIQFATPDLPAHAVPADRLPGSGGPHPFVARATGRSLDLIVRTPQRGQLLIGRRLAKEWDGLLWLVVRLLGLSVLCLAGAALLAIWLAKKVAAPIDELAKAAQRMTDRNLNERLFVNEKSSIEVLQLSDSLNQLVERLRLALERQTRFVADASHELRTPVAVILSQAEHTLHKERDTETYKDSLRMCLQSARRMKRLTDDLLFLAKADSQMLCLHLEPLDLGQCAAHTIELLRPLAMSHSVQIECELQPVTIYGDRDRFTQVLTNLITNAIRYNRLQGHVTLRVFARDADAVIEVQDNGIGISSVDLPHLFERFYQSDQARTHHAEMGMGLGLSLVHEIVVAHNGTISVQSEPEKGTTFTVVIPRETCV